MLQKIVNDSKNTHWELHLKALQDAGKLSTLSVVELREYMRSVFTPKLGLHQIGNLWFLQMNQIKCFNFNCITFSYCNPANYLHQACLNSFCTWVSDLAKNQSNSDCFLHSSLLSLDFVVLFGRKMGKSVVGRKDELITEVRSWLSTSEFLL